MALSKIGTNSISDDAVTTAKLPNDAVTSAKIADGTIATGNIADDAITAAKIDDDGTGFTVGDLTIGSTAAKKAGVETIWVPANSMYPETTNGCALITQVELGNGPEMKVLDFDPSSDEHAQFSVAFPKSWNEGTITFKAYFTVTGTNTGDVAWGLAGVAIADNDSINTAFGTTVVATAKAHSGTSNDLDVTAESGAVTIAGSPSTDEEVYFQITRDVSEDSLTADAKLLGIKLFFTTDAANDA